MLWMGSTKLLSNTKPLCHISTCNLLQVVRAGQMSFHVPHRPFVSQGHRRLSCTQISASGSSNRSNKKPLKGYNKKPAPAYDSEYGNEERGWWEQPQLPANDVNPLDDLTPWQIRALEQAYAVGRRKIQVSALAKDLDLDRTVVTEWFKRFSMKPESERKLILAERQRELEQQQSSQQHKTHRTPAVQQSEEEEYEVKGLGFVPFKIRKQQPRTKKIKQDVLRTLEMVYARSHHPSDEVIRSLWDLHKIPRSMAVEWFAARRKEDGTRVTSKSDSKATSSWDSEQSWPSVLDPLSANEQPDNSNSRIPRHRFAQASQQDVPYNFSASQTLLHEPGTTGLQELPLAHTSAVPSGSTAETHSGNKGMEDQTTVESLAMAYGEYLLNATKSEDGLSEITAPNRARTWRQVMTRHYVRNGLPLHKRISRSFWLSQLLAVQKWDDEESEFEMLF